VGWRSLSKQRSVDKSPVSSIAPRPDSLLRSLRYRSSVEDEVVSDRDPRQQLKVLRVGRGLSRSVPRMLS
jgi:hypothetical protein